MSRYKSKFIRIFCLIDVVLISTICAYSTIFFPKSLPAFENSVDPDYLASFDDKLYD